MKNKLILNNYYFFGNEVSNYGVENHCVDYETLSKSFDYVMNNHVIRLVHDWKRMHGTEDLREVMQYCIISKEGALVLSECTNEIVLYSDELDMHLWGITHYGTDWSFVPTDIEIDASLPHPLLLEVPIEETDY